MNNYIIPANSKKSQLILGFFTRFDLILFLSGVGTTLILLMLIPNPDLTTMVFMLLPVGITGFLVMPVLYYHNVLQFIVNILGFYFGNRKYLWKGWCIKGEYENE